MSENKTKPTEVSVKEFVLNSDTKKVDDSFELIAMMEELSGEKAVMWGPSIIGFGTYHYKYESGREGDMCKIGFSPRKAKFSLYVHHGNSEEEARIIERLGKFKQSKGCIYFNQLNDLNRDVLKELIKFSLEETERRYG